MVDRLLTVVPCSLTSILLHLDQPDRFSSGGEMEPEYSKVNITVVRSVKRALACTPDMNRTSVDLVSDTYGCHIAG